MALTTSLTIAGNLTFDPELRQTRDGKPVVNVSIAANPRAFDKATNEWKDGEPVFQKCSAFGDLAEHIANSLRKGMRVIAYGSLKTSNWVDKEGIKHSEPILQLEEVGMSLQFTNAQAVKAVRQESATDSGDSWATPGAVSDDTPF